MKPVANDHYKNLKIQPVDFIEENGLDFNQGNVIKYVCRYKEKGGIIDLKKAKYYLGRLIKNQEKRQPPEGFEEQEALINEIKAAFKTLRYGWASYATVNTASGMLTIYSDKPTFNVQEDFFSFRGVARYVSKRELGVNLKNASLARDLIIKL